MGPSKFPRRGFLAYALVALFVSRADGQERTLVEAARKEGKVTIFGSLQGEVMKAARPEVRAVFQEINVNAAHQWLLAGRPDSISNLIFPPRDWR